MVQAQTKVSQLVSNRRESFRKIERETANKSAIILSKYWARARIRARYKDKERRGAVSLSKEKCQEMEIIKGKEEIRLSAEWFLIQT